MRKFTPPRLASLCARCSPTLPLQGRVLARILSPADLHLPALAAAQRFRHARHQCVERLLLRRRILDRDAVPDLVAAGQHRLAIEDVVGARAGDGDRALAALPVGDGFAVLRRLIDLHRLVDAVGYMQRPIDRDGGSAIRRGEHAPVVVLWRRPHGPAARHLRPRAEARVCVAAPVLRQRGRGDDEREDGEGEARHGFQCVGDWGGLALVAARGQAAQWTHTICDLRIPLKRMNEAQ